MARALSSAAKNKLVTHLVQQKLSRVAPLEMNENTFASGSIFTTFACLLDILQANAMKRLKPISGAAQGGGTIPRGMSPLHNQAPSLREEGALKCEWPVYE